MKWRFKSFGALAAVALAASVFPTMTASAATTYEVQIGSFFEDSENAESMRFLPGAITVHKDDSLHFFSEGFHTATLLPVGESAQDWIDANATSRDDPFVRWANDPDDGAGAIKENVNVLVPNRTDCGAVAGGTPCSFDGKTVLNSGIAFEGPLDFTVNLQAKPGDVIWVVCLIHTHMRMKITVVEDSAQASDPAALAADNALKLAGDLDWALATDAKYERKQSKHETADGKTVWDVHQGVDNHWVSLAETYPKKLNVKKGDTVRWHFDSLIYDTHSATFPKDNELWFSQQQFETFNLVCDPDGDTGPGPDVPADPADPIPCGGNILQIESDFSPESGTGTGNGVVSNDDPENSGVRGANTGIANFSSYDVRFSKASGKKPYTFFCFFHGKSMFTKVDVNA